MENAALFTQLVPLRDGLYQTFRVAHINVIIVQVAGIEADVAGCALADVGQGISQSLGLYVRHLAKCFRIFFRINNQPTVTRFFIVPNFVFRKIDITIVRIHTYHELRIFIQGVTSFIVIPRQQHHLNALLNAVVGGRLINFSRDFRFKFRGYIFTSIGDSACGHVPSIIIRAIQLGRSTIYAIRVLIRSPSIHRERSLGRELIGRGSCCTLCHQSHLLNLDALSHSGIHCSRVNVDTQVEDIRERTHSDVDLIRFARFNVLFGKSVQERRVLGSPILGNIAVVLRNPYQAFTWHSAQDVVGNGIFCILRIGIRGGVLSLFSILRHSELGRGLAALIQGEVSHIHAFVHLSVRHVPCSSVVGHAGVAECLPVCRPQSPYVAVVARNYFTASHLFFIFTIQSIFFQYPVFDLFRLI